MISAGDRPANSSLTGQRYLGSRRTAHDAREYLCTDLITLADLHQWRYVQFSIRFLYGLLRRDSVPPPALAAFFLRQSISPHNTIRVTAQK